MSSVSSLFRMFRTAPAGSLEPLTAQERMDRRSSGLGEFTRRIAGERALNILDLGPTSPANIAHLTGLGHKVYNEDVLLASGDPALQTLDADGKPTYDAVKFLANNLQYEDEKFDAVLFWDVSDYMPEVLVKPMVERIHRTMKPGAVVMAFFHTRDAGPDAPYYRYHIAGADTLSLQAVWKPTENPSTAKPARSPMFRLQRVFNNRHVENLFRDFGSLKFFLARDQVREILVLR